jgi:hypothetical protein
MRDKELIQIGRIWGRLESCNDAYSELGGIHSMEELVDRLKKDYALFDSIKHMANSVEFCGIDFRKMMKEGEDCDD